MSLPLDGNPLTHQAPQDIADSYWSGACVTPVTGSVGLDVPAALNQHALFDSARRHSQFVRFIPRARILGYAVAGGKSVIYLAPCPQLDGITDAIAAAAPPGGWSNEWLLMPFFRAYTPSSDPLASIESLGDYYDIWERGQWFAPEMETNEQLLWQIGLGASVLGYGNPIAEGLPGYTYAKLPTSYALAGHLNQKACGGDPACEAAKLGFYRSCQIYKPPLEIESATASRIGGVACVAVTLTARMQNTIGETGGVPAGDISNDTTGWVAATIAAEPYRTDENALRLYLLWSTTGYNPPLTVGDHALNGDPGTLIDALFAAIIPTLVLVKLLPTPYSDGNDHTDGSDSQTWHDWFLDAETYLRAMCEGYIDPRSTSLLGCNVTDPDGTMGTGDEDCVDTGLDLFDYTFENLVLDATNGALGAFTTLPTVATARLTTDEVVADPWPSYGPLPRTPRAAELFNLYSSCVNKLTRARVMIPYSLQYREITYASAAVEIAPTALCSGGLGCGATGKNVWVGVGPAAGTVVYDTGWADLGASQLHAFIAAGFTNGSCYTLGGGYSLGTVRQSVEYRFALTDPDATYAIPEDWRDMFSSNQAGTMFCVWRYDQGYVWNTDLTTPCNGALEFDCGFESQSREVTSCQFLRQGLIDFGPIPPGGIHAVAWSGPNQCTHNAERHWYAYPVIGRTIYVEVPIDGEAIAAPEPEVLE